MLNSAYASTHTGSISCVAPVPECLIVGSLISSGPDVIIYANPFLTFVYLPTDFNVTPLWFIFISGLPQASTLNLIFYAPRLVLVFFADLPCKFNFCSVVSALEYTKITAVHLGLGLGVPGSVICHNRVLVVDFPKCTHPFPGLGSGYLALVSTTEIGICPNVNAPRSLQVCNGCSVCWSSRRFSFKLLTLQFCLFL